MHEDPYSDYTDQIGKYLVKCRIGSGSMGTVYEGLDPYVQRPVAIKVANTYKPTGDETEKDLKHSFFTEAHAAGKLSHPNIVSVYDAGIDQGQNYIVMELVKGKMLEAYTQADKKLELEKIIGIIFSCAKALDYAHRNEVIHRDLKPSNIMLTTDEQVKIMDFGVAQLKKAKVDETTTLTGSPDYMSPEQVQDFSVDGRSDLYSLGVVMFQLLAGRLPFIADNYYSLIYQIVHDEVPSIKNLQPDVPDFISNVVYKALEKDASKRYQSGSEMAADLSRLFDKLRMADREIENIERRDMLKELTFFKEFSTDQIEEVMYAATWQQFHKGDAIIKEGELDSAFYIIVSGSALVSKAGTTIGWINKGDCFGEVGFVTKKERTATIYSIDELTLMKVNATLMEQVTEGCQLRYYKAFTEALVRRLSEQNYQIIDSINNSELN